LHYQNLVKIKKTIQMTPYNDLSHIPLDIFLAAFENGSKRIKSAIKNLSEAEMKQRPIPNKWSIWEIVFHLTDAEIMGAARIKQAFTQSELNLSYYNPAIWANTLDYQNKSLDELKTSLRLFADLRATSLTIFKQATQEDWQKTALHPQRGQITLLTILRLYADHSERHLEQILERRNLLDKPLEMSIFFTERLY
jgi:uncharacterized damage-inducible protein DinB